MKQLFILVLASLFLINPISAQELTTSANKTAIQTGEPLLIDVSILWPSSFLQLKPIQSPDTLGKFERIKMVEKINQKVGEHIRATYRFHYTAFEGGTLTFPAIPIVFYIPTLGRDTTVYTAPLSITVQAPIVDTTQNFKPIQPIEEALLPWQDRVKQYALYALIALALIAIIYFIYRRFKKEKMATPIPTAPPLSAYEQTKTILLRLQNETALPPQGEKHFYTELGDALRLYLEKQFSIPCFDKTTAEIMEAVQRNNQLRPHALLLQNTLQQADIIKFAKATGTAEQREKDVLHALHLLEHTITQTPKARSWWILAISPLHNRIGFCSCSSCHGGLLGNTKNKNRLSAFLFSMRRKIQPLGAPPGSPV